MTTARREVCDREARFCAAEQFYAGVQRHEKHVL